MFGGWTYRQTEIVILLLCKKVMKVTLPKMGGTFPNIIYLRYNDLISHFIVKILLNLFDYGGCLNNFHISAR